MVALGVPERRDPARTGETLVGGHEREAALKGNPDDYRREPEFVQRIVDRGRHSLRESAGLQQAPEKNVRIKEQFHRLVTSHSLSGTAGETMSPVILPVVRNEPSHDFGCFGSGGGLTWAIGSPFRITIMSFPSS